MVIFLAAKFNLKQILLFSSLKLFIICHIFYATIAQLVRAPP
nr:MAG TPA: hypothetical protein [Caudoviricetes sp.]